MDKFMGAAKNGFCKAALAIGGGLALRGLKSVFAGCKSIVGEVGSGEAGGAAKSGGCSTAAQNKELYCGEEKHVGFEESKSRRVQLLLEPSLHERVKTEACLKGASVSGFIRSVLEDKLSGC